MKKGIRIEAFNRNGDVEDWEVESITIGKIFSDRSFGKYIKLYADENNIFQMEFLKGSDQAYTFLPKCTELLEILESGITGTTLGMIAKELLNKGFEEI
ncbi:MAG: hypothetical protein LUH47_04960 [Clostridiales bacterium]|nr:hypothetical protein [Clostridiales bacterium]